MLDAVSQFIPTSALRRVKVYGINPGKHWRTIPMAESKGDSHEVSKLGLGITLDISRIHDMRGYSWNPPEECIMWRLSLCIQTSSRHDVDWSRSILRLTSAGDSACINDLPSVPTKSYSSCGLECTRGDSRRCHHN